MELKNNFIYIYALLLLDTNSYYTNSLHLLPAPYPCCSGSSALPEAGARSAAHEQHYWPQPLSLGPETDALSSGRKAFGSAMSPPVAPADDAGAGFQSAAYRCSLLACLRDEAGPAVCACNFNTGNVVTFKNECDVKKHNCRFDTAFKVILNEICPWEFESRRSNREYEINYSDPKYYN